jgi:hypothetical protein
MDGNCKSSLATNEAKTRHWINHIFVKLLFVSSRAMSGMIVDGKSQVGWAVILPASDTLNSLSYRQRSELVKANGSKVAIRYLLTPEEQEAFRGGTRSGVRVGGQDFYALAAGWFDVIDVEAIVEANKGMFVLHEGQTSSARYPMFKREMATPAQGCSPAAALETQSDQKARKRARG